ncbi:NPCBM/NEW2 domain-containing protein [Nocardia sp. NBC_01329]|uniref:NPCBM/NEW2 domain-containing protein n=1 Tax=Nocardia sp. NBC_01329 TaxID=2903594 RepID=UPI002E1635EA|nr:NPCBM/NEW2 domain-containing protein [Nocardia sp. NBC_01329]
MSNPTEPTRGPIPRPNSLATGAGPGKSARGTERGVLLVSGAGVALAIVGLVVSLLVGAGSTDAETDTAQEVTTSESSAPAAPAPSAAPLPKQYLADMSPTSGTAYTGTMQVNGASYPHSIYQQFSGCDTEVSHTYNLNREWSRFSSTIGIAEGGNSQSVLQFEVIADGKSIYSSGNVAVGQSPAVDVSVTGVQNLTISFLFVGGNLESCSQAGNGVWGDAGLTK